MEGLAKRYFWVFNLLALGLLAYLSARVVNNVLAGKIAALTTTPAPIAAGKVVTAASKADRRDWAELVSNRNLFNSDPPEPIGEEDSDAGVDSGPKRPEGEPPGPGEECAKSDAKVGVLATMVAEPSDWSMAVIDDPDADESRLMKEGQQVGDLVLAAIQRDRIVLASGRDFECVDLGTKAGGVRKPRGSTNPTSGGPPPDTTDFKEGVKKVGKNSYEIDRGMLDEQLADLSKLSSGARVIPHYRDGKPQGFKIVGVRPGSLYSHIGVRSGDVIKAVGDEEITSPTKALELYEKLKNSDNVAVDIERRGRKMTLEYSIK